MIRSALLALALVGHVAIAAEGSGAGGESADAASGRRGEANTVGTDSSQQAKSAADASGKSGPVAVNTTETGSDASDSRAPVQPVQQQPAAGQQPPDTSIDRFRTPVEALTERMIGSASKSVRFDWRKSNVGFGLIASELLERNNFGSTRLGGMVRHPFGGVMGELAISHVFTWGTDSSQKLALTPYRQYGRPSRWELDVNFGYPLAEGVVTSMPAFFPAAELVFSATAGFRYLFYPGGLGGGKFIDTAKAVFAPQLTDRELSRMEVIREPGMKIDPARYGIMGGLSLDVYFQPGAFISPRAMIAVPILAPVTDTGLGLWWELNLSVGWTL